MNFLLAIINSLVIIDHEITRRSPYPYSLYSFRPLLSFDYWFRAETSGGIVTSQYFVAVIGAGPAGIFGARELANAGARVALFNRDIKPGGLAEYGIYLNKYTMKNGLRKQFSGSLTLPNLDYYGNITVGTNGDLTLDDLRALGFQAILVTVGAQGTKWLGLPGEELEGVYHAKDVVYFYNKLPPYSQKKFRFGKH